LEISASMSSSKENCEIPSAGARARVIQCIRHPVGARHFIAPIVESLNQAEIPTELWYQADKQLADMDGGIAVPHRRMEIDSSAQPLVFFKRLTNFRHYLRQTKVEVVHAHQMRAALIPLLAGYLEGVPVRIYHNHGLPYLGHRGPVRFFLRVFERLNISLATHVLLVSHSNLQAGRLDRLPGLDKAQVLGAGSIAGIDLPHYAPEQFGAAAARAAREKFGIPGNAFVLAYVGRPVKRKGFHRLLQAWEELAMSEQEGTLLIAGCSEEECRKALGHLLPGVKALGYMRDLRPFYAACDAVILPSDHEGFPYALLEGAAAGRALLGTDIPGIRCAILHWETGFLVPKNSQPELVEAIRTCATNATLCARLGRNARARVEAEFDRQAVLRNLLHFYEELAISAITVPKEICRAELSENIGPPNESQPPAFPVACRLDPEADSPNPCARR
jgi:N,N'-diacetylbacillosaminyl-diphospho-undecaprenol alpha-1,3-N-acetylgalactosaminyltransferase